MVLGDQESQEKIEDLLLSRQRQIEERFAVIEQEIDAIRRRNIRVEANKAWETSMFRILWRLHLVA